MLSLMATLASSRAASPLRHPFRALLSLFPCCYHRCFRAVFFSKNAIGRTVQSGILSPI